MVGWLVKVCEQTIRFTYFFFFCLQFLLGLSFFRQLSSFIRSVSHSYIHTHARIVFIYFLVYCVPIVWPWPIPGLSGWIKRWYQLHFHLNFISIHSVYLFCRFHSIRFDFILFLLSISVVVFIHGIVWFGCIGFISLYNFLFRCHTIQTFPFIVVIKFLYKIPPFDSVHIVLPTFI